MGDDLFDAAVRVIFECRQASISLLERELSIGYTRASRLMGMLEEKGFFGSYSGSYIRTLNIEKIKEYLKS